MRIKKHWQQHLKKPIEILKAIASDEQAFVLCSPKKPTIWKSSSKKTDQNIMEPIKLKKD